MFEFVACFVIYVIGTEPSIGLLLIVKKNYFQFNLFEPYTYIVV